MAGAEDTSGPAAAKAEDEESEAGSEDLEAESSGSEEEDIEEEEEREKGTRTWRWVKTGKAPCRPRRVKSNTCRGSIRGRSWSTRRQVSKHSFDGIWIQLILPASQQVHDCLEAYLSRGGLGTRMK